MIFRNYKEEDAKEIITWIRNEEELYLWSADIYNKYPIKEEYINNFYNDCKNKSNFYPMVLEKEGRIIGHLILRNTDEKNEVIRLGFVIIDPVLRGQGYGKKILNYAIQYAKEKLNAKEINLGVFEKNKSAYYCYKSVGFKEADKEKEVYIINNEEWKCIELVYSK